MRNELRRWRRELAPEQRCLWDSDIALRVLRLPEYTAADTLLCYISSREEVSTAAIIAHAIGIGKRVAVPRWQAGVMEFCLFDDYAKLKPDAMNLLQPSGSVTALGELDGAFCVTPALAADECGCRLGYGGGYYDRFLSANKVFSVTLIYPPALLQSLPRDPYDMRTDCVITPERTIYTNTGKENCRE